jgi:hypothetical protein
MKKAESGWERAEYRVVVEFARASHPRAAVEGEVERQLWSIPERMGIKGSQTIRVLVYGPEEVVK